MKAIAFFIVLLAAKVASIAGHSIPFSPWTPLAFIWQDVLAALIFAGLITLCRRDWIAWVVYGLGVSYVALNVAVLRILTTPITWPMLKAARGTLSDSVLHYFKPQVILPVAAVLLVGIGLATGGKKRLAAISDRMDHLRHPHHSRRTCCVRSYRHRWPSPELDHHPGDDITSTNQCRRSEGG